VTSSLPTRCLRASRSPELQVEIGRKREIGPNVLLSTGMQATRQLAALVELAIQDLAVGMELGRGSHDEDPLLHV
jgi:hypothetical protein